MLTYLTKYNWKMSDGVFIEYVLSRFWFYHFEAFDLACVHLPYICLPLQLFVSYDFIWKTKKLGCFVWTRTHVPNACAVGLQVAWPQHIPKSFTSWISRPSTGPSHPSLSCSTLWRSLWGRTPRKRPAAWRRSEMTPWYVHEKLSSTYQAKKYSGFRTG